MYQGKYNGKEYHSPDLHRVLDRAWEAGVERIIITAGSLEESKKALQLSQAHPNLYCTVGVHPTRCKEFFDGPGGAALHLESLSKVIDEGIALGKVVAIGECGLDYARLHFCDRDMQIEGFKLHFDLLRKYSNLPMFLHLRDACSDFLQIVDMHNDTMVRDSVVHSFDGTLEELENILSRARLNIGINGCSLRTESNLDVVAAIPMDRLLLETDAPWCSIRQTHASSHYVQTQFISKDKKKYDPEALVKGRNEPCTIVQVAEAVAGTHTISVEKIAQAAKANTERIFNF